MMVAQFVFLLLRHVILQGTSTEIDVKTVNVMVKTYQQQLWCGLSVFSLSGGNR